jgi:hypothetical protein
MIDLKDLLSKLDVGHTEELSDTDALLVLNNGDEVVLSIKQLGDEYDVEEEPLYEYRLEGASDSKLIGSFIMLSERTDQAIEKLNAMVGGNNDLLPADESYDDDDYDDASNVDAEEKYRRIRHRIASSIEDIYESLEAIDEEVSKLPSSVAERARRYWLANIDGALFNRDGWLGGSMHSANDTLDEIEQLMDGVDEEDL